MATGAPPVKEVAVVEDFWATAAPVATPEAGEGDKTSTAEMDKLGVLPMEEAAVEDPGPSAPMGPAARVAQAAPGEGEPEVAVLQPRGLPGLPGEEGEGEEVVVLGERLEALVESSAGVVVREELVVQFLPALVANSAEGAEHQILAGTVAQVDLEAEALATMFRQATVVQVGSAAARDSAARSSCARAAP